MFNNIEDTSFIELCNRYARLLGVPPQQVINAINKRVSFAINHAKYHKHQEEELKQILAKSMINYHYNITDNIEKLINVIKIWKESPRLISEDQFIEDKVSSLKHQQKKLTDEILSELKQHENKIDISKENIETYKLSTQLRVKINSLFKEIEPLIEFMYKQLINELKFQNKDNLDLLNENIKEDVEWRIEKPIQPSFLSSYLTGLFNISCIEGTREKKEFTLADSWDPSHKKELNTKFQKDINSQTNLTV